MSENLRRVTHKVGSGLKSFIKIHDPGPGMVAALLTGIATLFAIVYTIGHWG